MGVVAHAARPAPARRVRAGRREDTHGTPGGFQNGVLAHRDIRRVPRALPEVRHVGNGRRPGEGHARDTVRRVSRGALPTGEYMVRSESPVHGADAAPVPGAAEPAGWVRRLLPG